MPIMIGGGEFIINGAERVVVSQLHRSPGRRLRRRGRGGRQQAARLPRHPRARQLDRARRHQEGHARRPHRPVGQVLGDDAPAGDEPEVLDRRGDHPGVLRGRGDRLGRPQGGRQARGPDRLRRRHRPEHRRSPGRQRRARSPRRWPRCWPTPATWATIQVVKDARDPLILNTLQEDPTADHESALLRIYQRLRPGNPPQLEKARSCSRRSSSTRTATASAGSAASASTASSTRTSPKTEMTLRSDGLRQRDPVHAQAARAERRRHVDDIDHLGNRRLRTIDELAADELRKGFLKLRRTVQERMSLKDAART